MKTLPIENGDLVLDGAGNLAVVTGAEGLRQKIVSRLQLYQGDWFLEVDAGVPYVQSILGRAQENKDLTGAIAQIISSEILKEPEVLSIIKSEAIFDETSRAYSYAAKLGTIYGTLSISNIAVEELSNG
jgi:hypothetical protein